MCTIMKSVGTIIESMGPIMRSVDTVMKSRKYFFDILQYLKAGGPAGCLTNMHGGQGRVA